MYQKGFRYEEFPWQNDSISVTTCSDTSKLDPELLAQLANELTGLTAEGFLRFSVDSEIANDVRNHVVPAPRLKIVRLLSTNAPIAYIAAETAIYPSTNYVIYHLGGIIVKPYQHGSGLGYFILTEELKETKADFIVLRTQSERMRGLAGKVSTLDTKLALKIGPLFYPNAVNNVCRSAYRNGHSLYDDYERFEKDAIKEINWKEGDSLVVAGYINYPEFTEVLA